MRQIEAEKEDYRNRAEDERTYVGTALIGLEHLGFGDRERDQKEVDYLKRCFENDGAHHIERPVRALIERQALEIALGKAGISAAKLMNGSDEYTELVFPSGYQLLCLNGQDRIEAAREVLDATTKRWTVRLHLSGIVNLFREEFFLLPSNRY